jgi:ABC-type glycerol-3-phosphate transport system substrate-binding protein
MKKKITTIIIAIVCIVVAALVLTQFVFKTETSHIKDVDGNTFEKAYNLLSTAYLSDGEEAEVYYTDFIKKNTTIGEGTHVASLKDGIDANKFYNNKKKDSTDDTTTKAVTNYNSTMTELNYNDKAEYTVKVDKEGLYYLNLDYISIGESLSDYTVKLAVNGKQQYSEMNTIALPIIWADEDTKTYVGSDKKKSFPLDSYGDEIAPSQNRVQEWTNTYLYNNTYVSSSPLSFYLKKGVNKITIENVSSGGLAVGKLQVEAGKDNTKSYKEYASEHSNAELVKDSDDALQVDAVYYTKKNSSDAVYGSETKSSLTRFNIDKEKLNTLQWNAAGIEVTYTINVKKAGNYNLTFHYDNGKKEFDSFETIKIDGEVPFSELYNYAFAPVSSGYANETLSDKDGNAYSIYLTEGKHTISIKQENQPVMEAYRYALLLQQHITDFELEITKITGSDVDTERNWKMTKYIPEIPEYLKAYKTVIQHIRYILQDYSPNGNSSAVLTYLDEAEQFIKDMQKYPDEIALHTADLTGANNSILVSLSNFTTEVTANEFTLDRIYVTADKGQIEKPNPSAGSSMWTSIRTLVNTFTSDKYATGASQDSKTLTIWVNRAITHVDLLQKMVDTEFVPYYKEKTGKDIKVKVSTMPDVAKLTLAIAAKETPDVALGLMSYVPFDLSSRGALYDLTKFDDFWTVARRFPTGSFVSYVYNEGMYAIPETTDFNAIVYRTDIFNNLGLKVPSTWNELIDILPTLQRYGMNFYHNIALGTTGYKWFYQTSPMILQNGGELYTQDENGLVTTGIDSKKSVKGLSLLGNLFTKYSLETSVQTFFNSFRYSTDPIGIIGMEDYTLINNGAKELQGKWAIAPYLGTEQEDGSIDRTFVANGTGGAIFKTSNKKDESWEFLKWWTSKKVQTEYTYTLRSSYGKTFFWLSANKAALQNNPMDEADKKVITEQLDYVTDVTRTPGQYLLERTISNIWTTMVFDGTAGQVAVDEAKNDVNKEIVRKMQELGYYDENGKMVKKFKLRGYDWIKENQDKAKANPEEEVSK